MPNISLKIKDLERYTAYIQLCKRDQSDKKFKTTTKILTRILTASFLKIKNRTHGLRLIKLMKIMTSIRNLDPLVPYLLEGGDL